MHLDYSWNNDARCIIYIGSFLTFYSQHLPSASRNAIFLASISGYHRWQDIILRIVIYTTPRILFVYPMISGIIKIENAHLHKLMLWYQYLKMNVVIWKRIKQLSNLIVAFHYTCRWLLWAYWGSEWQQLQQIVHYNDVIMSAMASQITSLTIVYSTVYSGEDQRKYQSSVSLAFVGGTHRWPVNSPHKEPVAQKMFPFDDVIMNSQFSRIKALNQWFVFTMGVGVGVGWGLFVVWGVTWCYRLSSASSIGSYSIHTVNNF